jgi:hypothetical protein
MKQLVIKSYQLVTLRGDINNANIDYSVEPTTLAIDKAERERRLVGYMADVAADRPINFIGEEE